MLRKDDHCGEPRLSGTLHVEVVDVLSLHRELAGRVNVPCGPEVYRYGMLELAIRDLDGCTIRFGQPARRDGQ